MGLPTPFRREKKEPEENLQINVMVNHKQEHRTLKYSSTWNLVNKCRCFQWFSQCYLRISLFDIEAPHRPMFPSQKIKYKYYNRLVYKGLQLI